MMLLRSNSLLAILKKRFLLGVVTGNEERAAWHRLEKARLREFFFGRLAWRWAQKATPPI